MPEALRIAMLEQRVAMLEQRLAMIEATKQFEPSGSQERRPSNHSK